MKYKIRGVPAEVDNTLRARARASGKSLNKVAVEAALAGQDRVDEVHSR
jgi:hypothetical protein